MAFSPLPSSSPSANPTSYKYDVFLSFRGEDTRKNFISHLYTALLREKIKTCYVYRDEIAEREGTLSSQSFRAIEESKLSIVVFSENYASSARCLEELVHIVECRRKMGQVVMPVFYHVDPSDVRKQLGSYAAAFSFHEECLKHDRTDKLQQWRHALTEAGSLSGWDTSGLRSDSELVEAVVRDIQEKLNHTLLTADLKGLVGIEKRFEKIKNLLRIDSHDIRVVGIWGLGGIGKTTLAKVVYDYVSSQFEGSCFLSNVREESQRSGLVSLERQLIARLFDEENSNAGSPTMVKRMRKNTRVLLVLDDVDDSEQFEFLAREQYKWFNAGSRIMVTTRDAQVLRDIKADEVYEVEELNDDEAMQLFQLNAFRNNVPTKDYFELSETILDYSKGLPLAIKIVGSYLHSKSKYEWESAIDKLKIATSKQIQCVHRVSYDGLDDIEKDTFLDIACFLKGKDREFVEQLIGYGSFTHIVIDHLIDKSLLTINHKKKLWMHDFVQQMGWEIVREESIAEPGKRSRLWNSEDVYHVFEADTGTAAIEGIFLETPEINKEMKLSPTVFQRMRKLRLLKINSYDENSKKWKVHLPQGLQYLPSSLKYLHWDGYPLKCLPFNFNPKNLVGLVLTNSHIDNLPWQGQDLGHLKLLDLSHSKQLTKIPDLYVQAPNLECLHLQFCTCLAQVPSSIRYLDKLRILNLRGCSSIEEFPMLPRNIRNLDLSETSIGRVPSSIDHLYHLETLNLNMCEKIEFLPGSISSLNSLKELSICCCTKLKHLPDLPLHLQNLNAKGCTSLETVSESETALAQLQDDSFQHSSGRFDFRNCLKLDQNARAIMVIEAGLRIFKMATSSSRDEERGVSETWCPGNEIPKWFSHKFESSSIEIKLPPDWCSTNFLGFALGVVVDFKKCDIDDNFEFYFQFGLTLDSQPHGVPVDILVFKGDNVPAGSDHCIVVDSEHLFLFNYCNKNSFAAKNDKNVAEASFKFYSSNKSNCKVKKCGVELIYAKNVKMMLDLAQQVATSTKTKDAFKADFKDDGHSHKPQASGSVNVPEAHTKMEDVEKRFHDITQDIGESSSEIEGDDRISDFEDRSTQDFSASEIEEDPISDTEFGTLSYKLESRETRKKADTRKKEAGDLNPIENHKKKSAYSCSRIMSLSPVVDLFKHVLGRRSASDKDPRWEERRQAPDIVLHSTMTKLGTHNKQIAQHLKTVMSNTSHGSFSSPEMSSPSRVAPSHSTAAVKQLHETSEEIIDSLYSQIVAVEDQNNEILRNLRTLAPTTQDDQFVGLLPELASLPYASSVNGLFKDLSADEQHVEVPEDVIHSLRSHLTELQNHNQQILQYLHVAMLNSPDTTGRSYQAVQSQVAEEDSGLVSPQPSKEDDNKKKADKNDKKKEPDEKKAKEKEPLMEKEEEEPDEKKAKQKWRPLMKKKEEEPEEKKAKETEPLKAKETEPLMKKEKVEPDEKKAKEKEPLMKKEPPVMKAVFKVRMQSQDWTKKILKTIATSDGVHGVSVDGKRELVTVTGSSLDVIALTSKLRKKLKTHAEVISVGPHSRKAGNGGGGDGGKKALVDFGETEVMSRGSSMGLEASDLRLRGSGGLLPLSIDTVFNRESHRRVRYEKTKLIIGK